MRLARRILASLVLGALCTLLLAWACALWSAVTPTGVWHSAGPSVTPSVAPPPWLLETWNNDPSLILADYGEARGFGLIHGAAVAGRRDDPYRRWETVLYWGAGWPLPAFECYVAWEHGPITEVPHAALRAPVGIHAEDRRLPDSPGYVPLRPIGAGLAADAASYGAIILLVWQSFVTIRHRLERKPGSCTACGYDRAGLASDAKCPECGASAARTVRPTPTSAASPPVPPPAQTPRARQAQEST